MSVLQRESHVLPKPLHRDCVFFHGTTIESILPPCAPENSVELCFYCIEGNECPEHPHRRKMRSGIDCFTDDDFNLVDEHLIKNVHKTLDDEKDTKDFIFIKNGKDKGIKQEPCNDFEQKAILITTPVKMKSVANKRSTAKSGDHCHQEVMPVSEIPRKRFSRFREKTFVCDVCEAAFTLKQNVQSHLFIYHVQKDGSLKQHTRLMYKCDNCEKASTRLSKSFVVRCYGGFAFVRA